MSSDDENPKRVKKTKKDTRKKSKKNKKKKKDPNAPRRNLTAFIFFSKEKRPQVKAENPEATFGKIGSLLGKLWEKLDAEGKETYEKMAMEDKKRWEMEKKVYDENKKDESSSSDSSSDSD
ncbi:hypothetical protein SAMD00019534_035100 [Acytostelium subglobosum LB1]|uniref:hypothetical protein n=1 Tax=Acytostelium subglobosum LB1 TaxID=1410327 RepID=UPI000644A152|nr:hypothetical protein SAMD00019534_035100 [Acytostelium subglobosum LB1]GAM20335.1 hypothetical protein SAMD00019534_035100 [Acytostelium subglobosum LB1]|eukprot:XP_012759856.1 hypothetical protein SAMD00019534_035100 [Acytostelium subglobosum LB1]